MAADHRPTDRPWTARRVHRLLAVLTAVVIAWQGLTGLLYTALGSWAGQSGLAHFTITLHTGSVLGRAFGTFHPIFAGT